MDHYIGEIRLFSFNFVPSGWILCEGQILGATYGGDGRTTFAVPKLRGKGPTPYTHYCIALQGTLPTREQ
jgi:microcystin-dependent protein